MLSPPDKSIRMFSSLLLIQPRKERRKGILTLKLSFISTRRFFPIRIHFSFSRRLDEVKRKMLSKRKRKVVFNVAGKLSTSSWWPGFSVQTITTTIRVLIEHFHWFFLSSFLLYTLSLHRWFQDNRDHSTNTVWTENDQCTRTRVSRTLRFCCVSRRSAWRNMDRRVVYRWVNIERQTLFELFSLSRRNFLVWKIVFVLSSCCRSWAFKRKLTWLLFKCERERENEITKCKSFQKSTLLELTEFWIFKAAVAWACVTFMCDLMNAWMANKHRPNLSCILCWMSQHSLYFESRCTRWSRVNPMFTNFQR